MASTTLRSPFNSPLETGTRSLAILIACFPDVLDLERLVEFDYLVVHSGDVDGPASLHAPLPLRAGELLVRRGLIETGLLLMMSRNLVERLTRSDGIFYSATEEAAPFFSSLTTEYSRKLVERAAWAADRFQGVPTLQIRSLTNQFFKDWSSQFERIRRRTLDQ